MIQQQPARLRISIKLAYGFGGVPGGVMESAFNIFLLFFYQQIVGLDPALCGLALFISLCIDAVVDPSIGAWSDGLRTRFGRRHPLIYGAIVPFAVMLYAVFAPPAGLSPALKFVWLLGFASAARVALSLFVIPCASLPPELSKSAAERTTLNSNEHGVLGVVRADHDGARIHGFHADLLVGRMRALRPRYSPRRFHAAYQRSESWTIGARTRPIRSRWAISRMY